MAETRDRRVAPTRLRRILVALDGSEHAERALGWAAMLAEPSNAAIVLVQVVPSLTEVLAATSAGAMTAAGEPLGDPTAQVDAAKLAAREELERAGSRLATEVRIVIDEGRPGDAIVARARADDVDIIVMATHGRGGIARALMGSVADHVVRNADRPVLVVPVNDRDPSAARPTR